MRENDDDLSDIIQALAVDRGRTGGFDESRLRDKFEVLGPQIGLSELASSICVRLVEELGITWDERYGQLMAYKQAHGHCNVPAGWKDNPKLATWCGTQRVMYKAPSRKRGKLSPDRVKRLERLGFVWDTLAAAWEEMYAALSTYKQTHGDCNVPQRSKSNLRLAKWCSHQSTLYKNNNLSADRVKRLDQLGFVWAKLAAYWEEMFAALTAYKRSHGDCNVPNRWNDDPKLGVWCGHQRQAYRKHKLSPDQIKRLEQLGFDWVPLDVAWEKMFAALAAYKNGHGNCNVPQGLKDNPQLAAWCATQRVKYTAPSIKRGKLSPDRIKRLEELGFEWYPYADAWEEMYAALSKYKQTHGDCNVPDGWKYNPKLGMWCGRQRKLYKNKKLSPDRVTRLEKAGFVWDRFEVAWEEMFAALTSYKQAYGDCDVPREWKDNPSLADWCNNQRTICTNNKLSPDRTKRLKQLGFVWNPLEAAWEEMFAALTAYMQAHGDCNVPHRWKDHPGLGVWCGTQRQSYKNNKLPTERAKRLEQLGFVWVPLAVAWEETWEEMYAALTAYKQTHGDCNVPATWKDNSQLGFWCDRQRTFYKNDKLSADRVKRLKQLAFRFVFRKSKKK